MMYSVMLVDDDNPVLEFLSRVIPWKELGLTLHSTCKNGLVALENASESPPDILVTDIGMPQMDGLELIGELRKLNPKLRCIILSCMDDFAYAQRAMRLQVDDYVLKETMRQEQIIDLLRNIRDELTAAEQRTLQIENWRSITEENAFALKQQLLQRMLVPAMSREPEWVEEARRFGIEFDGKAYLPVFLILNRQGALRESPLQGQELQLAVESAAGELLNAYSSASLLPYSPKEFILLLPYRQSLKDHTLSSFEPYINRLQEELQRKSHLSVTILYGGIASVPTELGNSLALLTSAKERFYLSKGGVYTQTTSVPMSEDDLYAYYPAALQQIRDVFLEEDEEGLAETIHRWMELIRVKRYPPDVVKEWTLKIMYDNQARFQTLQHYQTTFSLEILHRMLADIDNIEELTDWVQKFFADRLPLVSLSYRQSRRAEIVQAQQYVNKNIGKKITLEEVADLLHINSSYFSRLFKKETGHNFNHYVTLTKMERAKDLLTNTNISVEEISEKLGYDNKSYFTKLFKKYIGGTPGKYRDF
jgi:two-component system response regulator YesN